MGAPALLSASVVVAAVIVVIAVAVVYNRKRNGQAPASAEFSECALTPVESAPEPAEPARRVNTSPLRALSAVDREAYSMEWAAVKRRFVDDPATAITAADRLVNRAMFDRGFPMSIFAQKAPEIALNYPAIVQNYQAGHAIVTRHTESSATASRGVSHAELNQAMLHFDALFQELLEPAKVEAINHRRRSTSGVRAS